MNKCDGCAKQNSCSSDKHYECTMKDYLYYEAETPAEERPFPYYEPIGWVGSTMLSRDAKHHGVVLRCSSRYCAACGYVQPCWVVKWEDGKITKPCVSGVKRNSDGALQIE